MRKQTGFTMIELLISLLIMGIAFAGIFAMQSKLARSVHKNEHMTQGMLLTSTMFEAIAANPAGLRAFQLRLNAGNNGIDFKTSNFCSDAGSNYNAARCESVPQGICVAALKSVRSIGCHRQFTNASRTTRKTNQAAMLTNLSFTMTCGDGTGSPDCVANRYCGSTGEKTTAHLECQQVTLRADWDVQTDNIENGRNGLESKNYTMRSKL